jgi:N-acetylglucosaminyl-diphospho-decaprenol L-rhamnosyltransferase
VTNDGSQLAGFQLPPAATSLPPVLSIIIVNWNVRELLRVCLQSIARGLDGLEGEVIVVDSASADGSPDMLRQEFPSVRLIACNSNVGFSAGNNLGLAAARGEFVLCQNPDTEIVDDALVSMLDYLSAHPDVGIVGPQLLNQGGKVQSTRYRFPTLADALTDSTILEQWFPRNRLLRRYHCAKAPLDQTQDVDWLTGACFMARRAVVELVGMFDEQFFMYSEELDLMKRIKVAGWRVVYLPSARVFHHKSQSSDQVAPLRHIRFQSSRVRYFRKHHGWLAANLLRVFILLSYFLQLLEESAKWLLGHKRPLRRERVSAYWQVLKSGLRV